MRPISSGAWNCFCAVVDELAELTELLLSLKVEPGDLLITAVRDAVTLRNTAPDALVALYRQLSESARSRFREEGRGDRENAERVTWAIVEILAGAGGKAAT